MSPIVILALRNIDKVLPRPRYSEAKEPYRKPRHVSEETGVDVSGWSSAEDAKLRRMCEQPGGITGAQAAEFFGRSRNAIYGRCHRLGLSLVGRSRHQKHGGKK